MKRRDSNMMLFANDDLHDDLAEIDDSIFEISVVSDDLVMEQALILIFEICFDEFLGVDLVDDEVGLKSEMI